jgi:hypothetical protein
LSQDEGQGNDGRPRVRARVLYPCDLYHILLANPFAALATCFCLLTVWACIRTIRGRFGPDRFLVAVLGFLSVCQGLRILISQNIIVTHIFQRFEGIVDAGIAALFLVAAFILKTSISEHSNTAVQLRLAESERTASSLFMDPQTRHGSPVPTQREPIGVNP